MIEENKFYLESRARYSEEQFDEFFRIARMTKPAVQMVAKDFLVAAGGLYLSEVADQETQLTRGELLKVFRRANRASAELASALSDMFDKAHFGSTLSGNIVSRREELIAEFGLKSDTYKILASIFPLEITDHGFRQTGLENSIEVLSRAIASIDTDQFERTRKNKIGRLTNWVSAFASFWFLAKGNLPTTGHYEKDFASRGSIPVDAMTYAICQLDADVSEHLVADAINATMNRIENDPIHLMLVNLGAVMLIVGSGVTYTPKNFLKAFLELRTGPGSVPQEIFDELWGSHNEEPSKNKEQSFASREQFSERLYSSEAGNKFLRLMMALDPK